MKRIAAVLVIAACLLPVLVSGDPNPPPLRVDPRTRTDRPDPAKAARDTTVLYHTDFSGGDFADWTTVDLTEQVRNYWQIDTYLAEDLDPLVPGNHAWACNSFDYAVCDPSDTTGGYGNNWRQVLEFTTRFEPTAAKALQTVEIQGICRYCPEDEDDQLYAEAEIDLPDLDAPPQPIEPIAGGTHDIPIDNIFTFDIPLAKDAQADSVTLTVRFVFVTDHRGSDEDCEAPADCGVLLDNLAVTINGVLAEGHVEDCEPGTPNYWAPGTVPYVGDFAHFPEWGVGDGGLDECAEPQSPVVTFVDDGVVVPGTGGTPGQTWTYGPGGYVLNTTGGVSGENLSLRNEIITPWIARDPTREGTSLSFSVFQHSLPVPGSPGIFYYWIVSSHEGLTQPPPGLTCACAPPADCCVPREKVFYGGPGWTTITEDISDLVDPDANWIRISLGVCPIGDLWPFDGDDATPAPYVNDFTVVGFGTTGPAMSYHWAEIAQDDFPASGTFDHANPSANSVRFDMARRQGGSLQPGSAPGDSIVVTAVPLGQGVDLTGPPVLHYRVRPNPLFDAARTAPLTGTTAGVPVHNEVGVLVDGRWAFDLPDQGLLFPGDVLHYYIRGEQTNGAWATLPPDTTGYASFGLESPYHHHFIVRALPSISGWWQNPLDDNWYPSQPQVLWWNDAGDGFRDEWIIAFRNLGMIEGVDLDIYETNAPDAAVGNGLGGRATPTQITMYNKIMYSSGEQRAFTLSTAEPGGDPGDDVGLLLNHPAGHSVMLSGAHWASDLMRTTAGQAFLNGTLGVTCSGDDLGNSVGTMLALDAATFAPVLLDGVSHWALVGNCEDDDYDAIEAGAGTRLAEFLDGGGNTGAFPQAAWVLSPGGNYWSFPFDMGHVLASSDPAHRPPGPLATRTHMILGFLGSSPGSGDPSRVPVVEPLRVHAATPNPFNPRTTVLFEMDEPGRVQVEIFDLRGRLVRTLIDGFRPAGLLPAVWEGDDDRGHDVAAGVYFCRVRALDRTDIQKVALVR